MTDERPGPDPSQPSPPPGSSPQSGDEHDESQVLEGAGDFTSGEGLVAFSGIVLLLVWVIFDVFLDEYGLSPLHVMLAVVAVLVPRLDPDAVRNVLPVATVMKLTGYALAILGVLTIIADIDATIDGLGTILGALITYVAYAMAFLGARQID